MQQWEYVETEYANLNAYDDKGWELCGIRGLVYIFKRPIGPDWEARCEAAEAYGSNPSPDTYRKWQEIKNKQV